MATWDFPYGVCTAITAPSGGGYSNTVGLGETGWDTSPWPWPLNNIYGTEFGGKRAIVEFGAVAHVSQLAPSRDRTTRRKASTLATLPVLL